MNVPNPDPFEELLRRQPLRPLPPQWKREILAAARGASVSPGRASLAEPYQTLYSRLSAFLWPSPAAWAGLAAMWLIILAFNLTAVEKSPSLAKASSPSAAQLYYAFRDQDRLLKELIGPAEPTRPLAPKRRQPSPTQPRTERQLPFATA